MQTTPIPSALAFERQSTIRSDQSYRALIRQNEHTPSQISQSHGSEISSNSELEDLSSVASTISGKESSFTFFNFCSCNNRFSRS